MTKLALPLPTDLSKATVNNTASLLRIVAFALISGAAIASRLFAVINYESIIHELYVLRYQTIQDASNQINHILQRPMVQLVSRVL